MKKLLVILGAAAMLCACKAEAPAGLTVISYNIRMGVANDGDNSWEMRKPASIAMVQTEKPDIFGVQEAFDFQMDYLRENLPAYKGVGVGREDGKIEGEIMGIFWNTETVEMLDWGTYWLSETPDVPSLGWDAACMRTATWAFMKHKATGREFFYVNTHLDHVGWEARRNGLALIESRIAEMNGDRGLPMVLTGDLNIDDEHPTIIEFDQKMQNARKVARETDRTGSYQGWGETSSIIDYVYFKDFSGCAYFKTLSEPYADIPYISDHYPVKAFLEF